MTGQATAQHAYHRALFGRFADWDAILDAVEDLTGMRSADGLMGFDQMGHFGPTGCALVAEQFERMARTDLALCEIGSGFGGVIRQLARTLERAGRRCRAVGVELVESNCRIAEGIRDRIGSGEEVVCADARALPFPGASFDGVVICGSAPHFESMADVLLQARHVLRDDGVLVMMEEVSLRTGSGALSDAFLALHPPGVFFQATCEERLAQLDRAGFRAVTSDLTDWALVLLDQRQRALKLFLGTSQRIFGIAEVSRIQATLRAAQREIAAGRIRPTLIVASAS